MISTFMREEHQVTCAAIAQLWGMDPLEDLDRVLDHLLDVRRSAS
jgi:hypothetical protein